MGLEFIFFRLFAWQLTQILILTPNKNGYLLIIDYTDPNENSNKKLSSFLDITFKNNTKPHCKPKPKKSNETSADI